MKKTNLWLVVSRREADRPRLLQAVALGEGAAGLNLRIEVDESGSFEDEVQVRLRDMVTGADGAAVFQWYKWPRNGPAHDLVALVTVSWQAECVRVYIENLFE